MTSTSRQLLICLTVVASCAAVARSARAQAAAPLAPKPAVESYAIELKIIEADHKGPATGAQTAPLDPRLSALTKELVALPLERFEIVDIMQKDLHAGEAFAMQFGKPERQRFLRVSVIGKQEGKVKLDVTMERKVKNRARREFKSDVSIPEGGTLVVVPTRKSAANERVLLLAISARTIAAAAEPPSTTVGTTSQSR